MTDVLYTCPFVPPEWIEAHGLRPRRLVPRQAVHGGLVEATEGLCPFARAMVNTVAAREDDAAVVFTTACDQMRRAAELFGLRCPDRPAFVLNVPATWQTPAARRLYADELGRLGEFLTGLGGAAPTEERLAEILLAYDDARRGTGILPARSAAVSAERPRGVPPLEDEGATGKKSAGPMGETPTPRPVPLAIVGGPLLAGQIEALDLIERLGGRIVLDATEGGEMSQPAPLDPGRTAAEPLAALVDAYFAIPHAMRRPDSTLHEYLTRELTARGVRGVLLHRQLWCDLWHGQLARIRGRTDLPVLDIDVADEDTDFGRQAGRIQAFMETIR